MDNAFFVRGFKRIGDLLSDSQRFIHGQRSAQVSARDKLHH
jgi:hypothetical protein